MSLLHRWSSVLTAAGVLVLVAVIVRPVLDNPFQIDELLLLYVLANYGVAALLLTPHGGHSLLTSNLSYVILRALFGLDSRYWLAVVVMTHLLNVLLLFRIVHTYTDRSALAGVCALLWGAAPVHYEALGWFAVYGQFLVATCVLWIVLDAARIHRRLRPLTTGVVVRWCLLLLAAATSFGVGLALAVVSGIAIILLLWDLPERARAARPLAALVIVVPAIYIVQQVVYHTLWPGEHVLYDAAAVMASGVHIGRAEILEFASCWTDLASYGAASLTLGPLLAFKQSALSFVGPLEDFTVQTVLHAVRGDALIVLGTVVGSAVLASTSRRCIVAGLGLLAVTSYGAVALWWVIAGRTNSQIMMGLPVGCAVLPRYHYVATAFLTVILALTVDELLGRGLRAVRAAGVGAMLLLAIATPWYLAAYRRLDQHIVGANYEFILNQIRSAAQRCPVGSVVYIDNRPVRTWIRGYENTALPGWAGVFALANSRDEVDGRRIRFVERDLELLNTLRAERGTRLAGLLVAPGEMSQSEGPCSLGTTPPGPRPFF
jgi:hypothetical protein